MRPSAKKVRDQSFNEQAAFLIETALDLIKQVLVKHSAAVLEEMHDQIVTRNEQIKQLAAERDEANIKGHRAITIAAELADVIRRLDTAEELLRDSRKREAELEARLSLTRRHWHP